MCRLATIGLLAALAGCGLPDGDYFGRVADDPDPTRLRYCNSGEPDYLDPALVTSTTGLKTAYSMFAGLTNYDMAGQPVPGIASSWEIGEDLRSITFHLRPDARWSNGRPITSADVRYSLARVLHPYTLSANAETLWKLANGEPYYANTLREVTAARGPFAAGDTVVVIGQNGTPIDELAADESLLDSNTRTARAPLALRDQGADAAQAYATVPAGRPVVIVELDALGRWAYVYDGEGNEGDGVYGWVPMAELTGQPYADVRYRVRLVADPGLEGEVTGAHLLMHPGLLGIDTPDAHTVTLRTDNPVPSLLMITPDRALRPTPREAVSRQPKRWTDPERVVTSGPFHLAGWYPRDRVELVRSPTFYDADQVRLERITVYNMNDQAASTNYYMQGSCDAMTSNNIPSSYLPVLSGEKRGGRPYLDYITAPYLGIYFYLVQTERIDNVHFRRALSYAIDRRALPKIIKGGPIPSAQLTPGTRISELSDADLAVCGVTRDTPGVAMIMTAGELCYVPPPGLDFDLGKARAELEIARREMGAKFPQTFSVKFNTGIEQHKLIAEYLQYVWQENLGLTVELASQEWKTFLKDTREGNYDVARMGWIGSFPDTEEQFLPPFKCDSPDNRTKWCSKEFERIFALAQQTVDHKQRLGYVYRLEQLVVQNAVVVPLFVYPQHHLIKPYVRDLAVNLSDRQPWRYAWIDPDWRAHAAEAAK